MPDVKTELRKARAALVAEFALKQRFERIEWEESVLRPELERLAAEAGGGNLTLFAFEDED